MNPPATSTEAIERALIDGRIQEIERPAYEVLASKISLAELITVLDALPTRDLRPVTSDITRAQRADTTRVSISAAVKGFLILLVGIMETQGLKLGPTAVLASAALLELVALAAIPENIYQRLGRRLMSGRASAKD